MRRRCARCGIEKAFDEFAGGTARNSKRDCYCRPCRVEYGRAHYVANRERYIDKAMQRTAALCAQNYGHLIPYLQERQCADCGERDVLVLEFDHVGDEEFMIGRALREKAWADILVEIEKCEVGCANCHRRRTAERGGFARYATALRHGAATGAPDAPPPR